MNKLEGALAPLMGSVELQTIAGNLKKGLGQQFVYGLGAAFKPYLVASLWQASGKNFLYVTADLHEANAVYDELVSVISMEQVLLFPPPQVLPYDFEAQSPDITAQRLRVLQSLLNDKKQTLIIAPVSALQRALPPSASLAEATRTLNLNMLLERELLIEELAWSGFERVDLVAGKGQFAVRGSIVDIYPLITVNPYRVEFFGDEIESIREFKVENQRAYREEDKLTIFPAREFVVRPDIWEKGMKNLIELGQNVLNKLEAKGQVAITRKLRERWEYYKEQASTAIYFPGVDNLMSLFYAQKTSLLDYLSHSSVILLDEPAQIIGKAEQFLEQATEISSNLLEEGRIFPFQVQQYLSWENLSTKLAEKQVISLGLFLKSTMGVSPEATVSFMTKDIPSYQGKWELVLSELERWQRRQYRILIFTGNSGRVEKMKELLEEAKLKAVLSVLSEDKIITPGCGQILVCPGGLIKGFELPNLKLVVLTEKDIFGQQRGRSRSRVSQKGTQVRNFADLEIGDLVVHSNHGIGRYLGVKNIEIEGIQRDYLHIQYSGEDRLYVPTDQVHLLQKYIGVEGRAPRLNKLGGADWNRVKNRVRVSVQALAFDLLKLNALRETSSGYAFSPDTVWQQEFESTFPFTETPDQKEAIVAVKKAMEAPKPMDHLVCGDVGYGKTEVAIRAAFKAVMDGKQVAVLVPTTILAQQHYQTFRERFSSYPVKVEMLSRFRTPAQQRATLQGLRQGLVDVVIGTHRILQKDVQFKDLGLLVVDEEQRFGVNQKEMIKKLRESVDVLTLTATPIPRTLHMALAGLRAMSLIETPPENRHPVQTYVLEHDFSLIRDAISQEIMRGGQIFYVYNRVQTIEREARRLQELLPEASVAIAHGQMPERELEEVTLAFMAGEYDILVCTTIIENGLDLPNVNTLIVTDADMLGLAQLYQLRGRVGRSAQIAYAYFTHRKQKILSAVAQKRLQALRDFTELGSGFRLALRDLEIRGAGDLLGAEQHGHIANIGFELYCRLLENAVQELKGQTPKAKPELLLDLSVSAYLPSEYISDERQKIDIYKAIADLKSLAEIDELRAEIIDRFGSPPLVTENLLQAASIKIRAGEIGVISIVEKKGKIIITFLPQSQILSPRVFHLVRNRWRRVAMSTTNKYEISVRVADLDENGKLKLISEIITGIVSLAEEEGVQYNRTS